MLLTAYRHSRLDCRPDFRKDNQTMNLIFLPLRQMTTLNRNYTGHAQSTDVLAFDFSHGGIQAGHGGEKGTLAAEIYVCPDVALQAARTYSMTPAYELFLYLVHGMLHLAGHDDHDPVARQRMRRAEKQVMDAIFITEYPETFFAWKRVGRESR